MSTLLRRRPGFTLVELLVVIGIIAVLISILLPSLAKARQAAVMIQCGANMRSVGQAVLIYEQSYRKLPAANVTSWGGGLPGTPASNQHKWVHEVSRIVGTDTGDGSVEWCKLAAVLRCPAAQNVTSDGDAATTWHYVPSPRVMPELVYDNGTSFGPAGSWGPLDIASGQRVNQTSTASIRKSSEKAMLFEGPQYIDVWSTGETHLSVWSFWNSWQQFNAGWGHCFIDPSYNGEDMNAMMPIGQDSNAAMSVQLAHNTDIGWAVAGGWPFDTAMRFRHGEGRSARMNVLFCDGHVEAMAIGTLPKSMFLINAQR